MTKSTSADFSMTGQAAPQTLAFTNRSFDILSPASASPSTPTVCYISHVKTFRPADEDALWPADRVAHCPAKHPDGTAVCVAFAAAKRAPNSAADQSTHIPTESISDFAFALVYSDASACRSCANQTGHGPPCVLHSRRHCYRCCSYIYLLRLLLLHPEE